MRASDWRKLVLMSLLVASGRAADECTTFMVDPTLYSEGNLFLRQVWLASGLPWNWTVTACLEAVFVLLLGAGIWFYMRNYRSFLPREPGYSFKSFTAFIWSSRDSNWRLHLRRLSVLGVYGLVAVTIPLSYWAAASNLCLLTVILPIIKANPLHPAPAIDIFDTVQRWLRLLVPVASLTVGVIWMRRRWYIQYIARAPNETSVPSCQP